MTTALALGRVPALLTLEAISYAGRAAASVVIARHLGAEGRGDVALLLTLGTLLAGVGTLGVQTSTIRFLARFPHARTEVLAATRAITAIGVASAVVASFAIIELWLDGSLASVASGAALTTLLIAPLWAVTHYSISVLQADARFLGAAVVKSAFAQATFAGGVGAVLIGADTAGLLRLVIAVMAIAAIGGALAVAIGRRGVNAAGHDKPNGDRWVSRLVGYSLRGHIGTILQSANYRLDIFIIAAVLAPADVGIYVSAVAVAEVLWLAPEALGGVLMQQAAAEQDVRASARATAQFNRLMVAGVGLGSLVLLFAGGPILEGLFGSEFRDGANALRFLLPGVLALTTWRNVVNDLTGRGDPLAKTVSSAAALVLTVILDLTLVPELGIEGAAIASSVAYSVAAFAGVRRFLRSAPDLRISDLLIPRLGDLRMDGLR